MIKGKSLVYNTVLLTATSVLMRLIGLMFQIYLSGKIGAAGLGLFGLISSVSVFAQTVAISGIRFTTTRLVSEEIGRGSGGSVRAVVRRCLIYAMCAGTIAAAGLFFMADFIGTKIISDSRAVLSLRILALSLPWMSMGTVLSGYFTAVCRVMYSAAAQLFEQLIRICTVMAAFMFVRQGNLAQMCAAVVAGGITGETLSFFLILAFYLRDRRRFRDEGAQPDTNGRIFSTAVPLAMSAYARTALNSVQNLLIPKGLRASGSSYEAALSSYGMVQGMVFPIIGFPAAFFASVSELIVPELTEAQVRGKRAYISKVSCRLLRLCMVFSVGVMVFLIEYAGEAGLVIYKNGDVGELIKMCSLLMPIMYMDTVTDGMLRGLGQHMYCMYLNITDSFLCLVLVRFLLPRYAQMGYIAVLYISEIYNFSLSIYKLRRETDLHLGFSVMVKAVLAAMGAVSVSRLIIIRLKITAASVFGLCTALAVSLLFYILLLAAMDTLPEGDRSWLRKIMKISPQFAKKAGADIESSAK